MASHPWKGCYIAFEGWTLQWVPLLQTDAWKEAALKNVNDDPKLRAERIAQFREKLTAAGISLLPGDDRQLLSMLRAANCDVQGAIDVAKAFLEYQQYCSEATPSKTRQMIQDNKKLIMVLPHRDKFGRRVIVYRMWDAVKYPYKDIMNMFYVICMALAQEAKTQIAGITLVGDMSGMTRRHVPSTWADVTAWATFMKGGAPVWFHESHIINAPWLFQVLFNMAKPLLNERAYGNTILHKKGDSLSELHKHIPKDILPSDFGGDAGDMDNSSCLEAVLQMEKLFLDLQKSTARKLNN